MGQRLSQERPITKMQSKVDKHDLMHVVFRSSIGLIAALPHFSKVILLTD